MYDIYEERDDIVLVMKLIRGGDLFDQVEKETPIYRNIARLGLKVSLLVLPYKHKNRSKRETPSPKKTLHM